MNRMEYLDRYVDIGLFKKAFLWLSAGILVLIPLDGILIRFEKPNPERSAPEVLQQTPTLSIEPEASYLALFDRNTLFGRGVSEPSLTALRASIAELTKDYRLKGVVLAEEPEAILEDARTQKTSFVKIGQQVGDLTVNEIGEGFIVLGYLSEEARLEIQ